IAIAAALLALMTGASAQPYPNRAVKVIVPFAPGGVTDTIARLWAQRMSQGLGQQFYVENHGGGGSNLGMGLAARQPADGYTIAGHTPIAFAAMTSVPAMVESGKLRALVVSGTHRTPALPDVPTMAEAGISGHEANTLTAILVPAGTPKDIVDRIYAETLKIEA